MFYTSCIYCFTKKTVFRIRVSTITQMELLTLHQTDLNSERVTFQNYPKPNEISNKYITLKKTSEKADKAKKTQNKNNSNPGKGIGVQHK